MKWTLNYLITISKQLIEKKWIEPQVFYIHRLSREFTNRKRSNNELFMEFKNEKK